MKNSLALIITFSSILLLFTGCSIGKETYENSNFTFEYPKEWKVGNLSNLEEFSDVNAFVYYLDESGNTIANMNITRVSVVGALDTGLFAEQSITEAESYSGYKKIKEQKLTVAGQKTRIITFEATGTDICNCLANSERWISLPRSFFIISILVLLLKALKIFSLPI